MLKKVTVFAILIALVLTSVQAIGVSASGVVDTNLEKEWDHLMTNFNQQSFSHTRAHKLVDNWLKSHKNGSDKAEVEKHLSICNAAMASAQMIVTNHAGFDKNGKVIDRALAQKSIKDLSYYLQQHAGSLRNLKGHAE